MQTVRPLRALAERMEGTLMREGRTRLISTIIRPIFITSEMINNITNNK